MKHKYVKKDKQHKKSKTPVNRKKLVKAKKAARQVPAPEAPAPVADAIEPEPFINDEAHEPAPEVEAA